MSEMYVWKVEAEVEYEERWQENKKKNFKKWTDTLHFAVASPSGFGAIQRVKEIFTSGEVIDSETLDSTEHEVPCKVYPIRVVDITYLELLQTLDG